jgi:hypothetical protein
MRRRESLRRTDGRAQARVLAHTGGRLQAALVDREPLSDDEVRELVYEPTRRGWVLIPRWKR